MYSVDGLVEASQTQRHVPTTWRGTDEVKKRLRKKGNRLSLGFKRTRLRSIKTIIIIIVMIVKMSRKLMRRRWPRLPVAMAASATNFTPIVSYSWKANPVLEPSSRFGLPFCCLPLGVWSQLRSATGRRTCVAPCISTNKASIIIKNMC